LHTFAGRQYVLEYSGDLNSNHWANLPDGTVSGSGQEATVTDSLGTGTAVRFYRVKQQ